MIKIAWRHGEVRKQEPVFRPYGPLAHWELNEFLEEGLRRPQIHDRDPSWRRTISIQRNPQSKFPWWSKIPGSEQEEMFNKPLPHHPDTVDYMDVRTSKARYPEYNLVLGVMRESLFNLAQPNRLNDKEQKELWEWWQRHDDEPFSFNHLCHVLDLDPRITRQSIIDNVILQGTSKLKDTLGHISKTSRVHGRSRTGGVV